MTVKKVALLTSRFPYEGGEQFIESEIFYWNKPDVELVIFPMQCAPKIRAIPQNATVNSSLVGGISYKWKIFGAILTIFSQSFWGELKYIFSAKKLSVTNVFLAFRTTAVSYALSYILRRQFTEQGIGTVYCYWNHVQAYAASLLKQRGIISKVYTRIHRFDLYEEESAENYMPLKRQLLGGFDCWLVICNSAKDYLIEKYSVEPNKIHLSRLGVEMSGKIAAVSSDKKLNLLSVSYCVDVKRLDKLIIAVSLLSKAMTDVDITWTHIGGGPLFSELRQTAMEALNLNNVKCKFLGHYSNSNVKSYFANNAVDIFVNTSQSEGVPVSIMEAMSFGVPVVAPNVGGVNELLVEGACVLMGSDPSPSEIADSIGGLIGKCKSLDNRKRVRNKIVKDFNAKLNFNELVQTIIAYD